MIDSSSSSSSQDQKLTLTLGISIGLLASFIQSFGLTIQRKSHLQNERLPLKFRKPDYLRPAWWFGFTIYFSFNILGSIFQIGTLPIIILGPLGAVSLLWNAILAKILLGDRFSSHLILGTLLIAIGALLIAIYGVLPDHHYSNHDLDQLLQLYSRSQFLIEIVILIISLSILCSFAHLYEFRLNQSLDSISLLTLSPPSSPSPRSTVSEDGNLQLDNNLHHLSSTHSNSQLHHHDYPTYRPRSNTSPNPNHYPTPIPRPHSLAFPQQSIDIIESDIPLSPSAHYLSRSKKRSNRLHQSSFGKLEPIDCQNGQLSTQKVNQLKLMIGIAYGSTSGTLSGICLLFAKTGVELLIRSLTGPVNEFHKIQTWLILLVLLISALLQLWYLNKALRLVNPTLICPLAFCFYNLSSIISSLVFYDQFKLLSTSQILAITIGTIVLLGGVWIVSIGTNGSSRPNEKISSSPDINHEEDDDRSSIAGSTRGGDEETPLLPSSDRLEDLRDDDGDDRFPEGSMMMDDSFESGQFVENPTTRRLLLESNDLLSQSSSRRRSHPFDQLIRQFIVEGEVLPVRGFSIGISAASPGFAIRPNGRRKTAESSNNRTSLHWDDRVADLDGSSADEDRSKRMSHQEDPENQ